MSAGSNKSAAGKNGTPEREKPNWKTTLGVAMRKRTQKAKHFKQWDKQNSSFSLCLSPSFQHSNEKRSVLRAQLIVFLWWLSSSLRIDIMHYFSFSLRFLFTFSSLARYSDGMLCPTINLSSSLKCEGSKSKTKEEEANKVGATTTMPKKSRKNCFFWSMRW